MSFAALLALPAIAAAQDIPANCTGFERIAVRPRYYRGGIDAIIMQLGIRPPSVSVA